MDLEDFKDFVIKKQIAYYLNAKLTQQTQLHYLKKNNLNKIVKKQNSIKIILKLGEEKCDPSHFVKIFTDILFEDPKIHVSNIDYMPIKYKYKYQSYWLDDYSGNSYCTILSIKIKYKDFYNSYKKVFDNLIFK